MKQSVREVTIKNKLGLHARPASLFVQMATGYDSEITVARQDGSEPADGKSLMSMLILTASCGTVLTIKGEGRDSEEAVQALAELVDRGFDED
jgi:phosphocarrier protein